MKRTVRVFSITLFVLFMFLAGCSSSGTSKEDVEEGAIDSEAVEEGGDVQEDGTNSELPKDAGEEVTQGVDPNAWDWSLPDPNSVYVFRKQLSKGIKDEPYQEDYMEFSDTTPKNCNTILAAEDTVFAGTDDGVFKLTEEGFKQIEGIDGPVLKLLKNPFDSGFCFVKGETIHCKDKTLTVEGLSAVASGSSGIWYATDSKVFFWDGEKSTTKWDLKAQINAIVELDDGKVAVATTKGVVIASDTVQWLKQEVVDPECLSVAADSKRLVVGSKEGLSVMDLSSGKWTRYHVGIGGLPSGGIRGVAVKGDTIVMAYEYGGGAMIGDGQHLDYYVSHRWVPDDDVRAVAIDSKGGRWYCTKGGVSKISLRKQTLKHKAEVILKVLEDHFWRMDGFVSPEAYKDPNTGEYHLSDADNDGLWTEMMIGAYCYAYAVTGDEKYKASADRAMKVMYLLIDVPAETFKAKGMKPGFVARSLCREGEECYERRKQDKEEHRKGSDNWYFQEYKGVKYLWKDDTSSDEITGHLFGMPLYYDLCAKTKEEKEELRKHYLMMVDYIVDNGYRLINLQGKETTWGHWQPERLAIAMDGDIGKCIKNGHPAEWCISSAYGGGWLNSLEILALLISAYHVSGGNEKYFNAFKELILKYNYWKLAMGNDRTWTVTKPTVANHSDHELAMLSYHTLLRYEPDPKRREWWLKSLKWFYQYEKPERNPLWTAFISMFLRDYPDIKAGVQSLREIPLDLRMIRVDNSHRKDAKKIGIDRHKNQQFDRVFPYDEIRTVWWNGNFYVVVSGGSDNWIRGPMAYLLPYWAARFSGMIK